MSAVRAVANAGSWSLTTGFKDYFSCCFSKSDHSPATAGVDVKAAADSSEQDPDRVSCRRSSAASVTDDDGNRNSDGAGKMVYRRLEADGASVHSTGTDRVNHNSSADQLDDDMTSSHGAGATSLRVLLVTVLARAEEAGSFMMLATFS